MITIQSSGAQRLFDHPVHYIYLILKATHVARTRTHAHVHTRTLMYTHAILFRIIFTINGDQFPALR
jgi:hypothetical protein